MTSKATFPKGVHSFNGHDDTALKYHVQGEGPLLIIQPGGWGISSAYLRTGLAPLEKHFTLVCMDTRGSGQSERPKDAGNMSDSDMADDLEYLRAHLSLQKFDLLGHSQGGSTALLYAERYPSRVGRLVLVTHRLGGYGGASELTSFAKQKSSDQRYAKAVSRVFGPKFDPVEQYAEWVAYMQDFLQLYITDPPTNWPAFAPHVSDPSGWANKAWVEANVKKEKDVDAYSRLHEVQANTLCVGGDEDPVCTVHTTRVTHARIADAEALVIRESGHFPWIEQPGVFFPKMVEFFKP